MTPSDSLGYLASALVLTTFCTKDMISLRRTAIASNFGFIGYALPVHLWPILLLHLIMLPLNIVRIRQARAAAGQTGATANSGLPKSRAPKTRGAVLRRITKGWRSVKDALGAEEDGFHEVAILSLFALAMSLFALRAFPSLPEIMAAAISP